MVHELCEEAYAHPEKKRSRYVKRMTPITSIRKVLSVDLEVFAREILKPYFHSGGPAKKVCCSSNHGWGKETRLTWNIIVCDPTSYPEQLQVQQGQCYQNHCRSCGRRASCWSYEPWFSHPRWRYSGMAFATLYMRGVSNHCCWPLGHRMLSEWVSLEATMINSSDTIWLSCTTQLRSQMTKSLQSPKSNACLLAHVASRILVQIALYMCQIPLLPNCIIKQMYQLVNTHAQCSIGESFYRFSPTKQNATFEDIRTRGKMI